MTSAGWGRRLLRRLRASPAFTVATVSTLAIAVAANLIIFTVVNAVLLRPLPFPDSGDLVMLRHAAPGLVQLTELPMSPALYFLYAAESETLEGVTVFNVTQASFTDASNPERVPVAFVSASFFRVLRSAPRLGRGFVEEDERPGAAPVVVLSDGVWQARFGGDADIVGRVIEIDGRPTEVVGVMHPTFAFPRGDTAIWQPMTLDPTAAALGAFDAQGIGRVAAGVGREGVQAELETMAANLVALFPEDRASTVLASAGFRPRVDPAHEVMVGDIRATLLIVWGAVAVLLLIACANTANLFLVRAEARHHEVAIRVALGETRARVQRSLMAESVVLGVIGGVAAFPLTWLGVRLIVRYGPEELPRLHEVSIDGVVLVVGLALSLTAGLVFGLAAALRAGAVTPSAIVTEGARGASAGRERHLVRRTLVVVQVALALTLLVVSGLAVRSFQRLAAVDPGFAPADLLTLRLALPEREYEEDTDRLTFSQQVVTGLSALPGVEASAAVSHLPLGGVLQGAGHSIEGRPREPGDVPPVFMMKSVSPGYFATMRIPILEGRDFEPLDEERDAHVAVISEVVARRYWPGESALGKGIRPGVAGGDDAWYRVVGVVGDVHEIELHEEPPELVYYPLTGLGAVPTVMSYVARANAVESITGGARQAVRQLDPNLPISDIATMASLVRESRSEQAFVMMLLLAAAVTALVLGAVGLYGVISYMVAQRRTEIAIRMAVGAQVSDVRRLVLGEALGLALAGGALGVGLSILTARRLEALLFETSPIEPAVLLSVSVVLVVVCLTASWLPARRAASTSPMAALRLE